MSENEYNHLIEVLKVLSKNNSRDMISGCLSSIEMIFRTGILSKFEYEINDKETRDEITKIIKDIFDNIVLKGHTLKTIVVCNSMNNPPDIVNKRGLIVQIAIEIDDKLYTLKIRNKDDL